MLMHRLQITTDFKYLPFGGGRRKCIGDQFALFESIVALSMLTRRFTFTLAPDSPPVTMTTGATIHTTAGLYMNVTPRDHSIVGTASMDVAAAEAEAEREPVSASA